MKKKLKLRKWVKVTLIVIATIGVLAMFNKGTDRAIQSCIEAGNSVTFCERVLK